jgi:hypothetical protein
MKSRPFAPGTAIYGLVTSASGEGPGASTVRAFLKPAFSNQLLISLNEKVSPYSLCRIAHRDNVFDQHRKKLRSRRFLIQRDGRATASYDITQLQPMWHDMGRGHAEKSSERPRLVAHKKRFAFGSERILVPCFFQQLETDQRIHNRA